MSYLLSSSSHHSLSDEELKLKKESRTENKCKAPETKIDVALTTSNETLNVIEVYIEGETYSAIVDNGATK